MLLWRLTKYHTYAIINAKNNMILLMMRGVYIMNADERKVLQKAQRISSWNSQKLYHTIGKTHQRTWAVKRNEVYFVDLGENIGSEENKIRPVVVLQANSYNFSSPVFTCAIISTSPMTIADIQIPITGTYTYTDMGISKQLIGTIDLGQIKTIAKERIVSRRVCELTAEVNEIDEKLLNIFGLTNLIKSRDNVINSLTSKCEYLKNKQK